MKNVTTKALLAAASVLLCLNLVAEIGFSQDGERERPQVVGIAATTLPPSNPSGRPWVMVLRAYSGGAVDYVYTDREGNVNGAWQRLQVPRPRRAATAPE